MPISPHQSATRRFSRQSRQEFLKACASQKRTTLRRASGLHGGQPPTEKLYSAVVSEDSFKVHWAPCWERRTRFIARIRRSTTRQSSTGNRRFSFRIRFLRNLRSWEPSSSSKPVTFTIKIQRSMNG